jgi:hypothetical protein
MVNPSPRKGFSIGGVTLGDDGATVEKKLGTGYIFKSYRPIAPAAVASMMTLVSASKEREEFLFEFLQNSENDR